MSTCQIAAISTVNATTLTSNSQSALRTFSSKLGSTKLTTSLGMVDSVSFRSTVNGILSRRLDGDDLPSESELDRGGGEDCFPGADMSAGVVADSFKSDRLPGWRPYGVWPGLLGSEWSAESHTDGEYPSSPITTSTTSDTTSGTNWRQRRGSDERGYPSPQHHTPHPLPVIM